MTGHDGSGKWFGEVAIGERFARTGVTVAHAVGKIRVADAPAADVSA